MTVKPVVLTPADSTLRSEMEAKIAAASKAYYKEIGTALRVIHDKGLYKSTHRRFDAYCKDKWKINRAHAHRLINGAKIAKELSPVGDIPTERVARAIAKVPEKDRKVVLKAAIKNAKSGARQLTGKDVAEAAKQLAARVTPGPQAAAKAGDKKDAEVTYTANTSSAGNMDANKNGVAVQPSSTPAPLSVTMSPTTEELYVLWLKATATEREAFLQLINARLIEIIPAQPEGNSPVAPEADDQQLPLTLA